jgi:hypothetical protein
MVDFLVLALDTVFFAMVFVDLVADRALDSRVRDGEALGCCLVLLVPVTGVLVFNSGAGIASLMLVAVLFTLEDATFVRRGRGILK